MISVYTLGGVFYGPISLGFLVLIQGFLEGGEKMGVFCCISADVIRSYVFGAIIFLSFFGCLVIMVSG